MEERVHGIRERKKTGKERQQVRKGPAWGTSLSSELGAAAHSTLCHGVFLRGYFPQSYHLRLSPAVPRIPSPRPRWKQPEHQLSWVYLTHIVIIPPLFLTPAMWAEKRE